MKDVLATKKHLLKKSEVQPIKVPFYDELSVKALWPQFAKDKKMNIYFPDKFAKDKGPPREYFFNILNTIYPEYLQQIMAHASKERMAADGSNNLIDSI